MKIFIQARKDGYNILFPTHTTPEEFYQFADDIQPENAKNDPIYYGRNFYTLAFASSGCIFTKYVIGYDIQRNYLGNIGISVFIPNTQKLSGNDVKILLDDLLNTYCNNYCPDYNISDKREDWLLITSLADRYDIKLQPQSSYYDAVTAGTQNPAFHYYKSDSELIEHLDKPYQVEYSDYKQILFIDSNLQGIANPLNVIKNSGVEVNPDLQNEFYYLNNYNNSKHIKITANGKLRSDKKGENQIRAKWQVEIKYSKDERCYEPINARGTLSDKSSEIYKYLEIKGNQITLKYDAFNNPKPIIKPVIFEIKDINGKKVVGAVITYQTDYQEKKKTLQYTIHFTGEEVIKKWRISSFKDENQYSKEITVTPENQSNILLVLEEHKKVKITANDKDNCDIIYDFVVYCQGKHTSEKIREIEFVGDEINRKWNISLSHSDYHNSENKEFHPKIDGNEINFQLKKSEKVQKKLTYCIDATKNGGNKKQGCPSWSNYKDGRDVVQYINPPKGHKFDCFVFDGNDKGNRDGTLIAIYEKNKVRDSKHLEKWLFTGGTLVVAIVILAFFLRNRSSDKKHDKQDLKDQIEAYIEGDSLLHNTLNEYKVNWEKQELDFITKSGGGIFGGEEIADSAKWKSDWRPVYENIENAIEKRNLINKKNFIELIKQRYSPRQLSFKTAIEKIDSTKYAEVRQKLGDVSTLTLTQIAQSIDAILTPKEQEKKEQPQVLNKEEKKPEQKKETSAKTEQKKEQPKPEPKTAATDKTSEIIQYIKDSDLIEAKLKEYKNTEGINKNLKNSIQLCLDFWALDGSGSGKNAKTYYSFRDKLNVDDNFKNSKLKAFVDKMCQEGTSPSYSKQDKKKGLK